MLPSNPSPSRPPAQPSPLRFSSTPFDSASHETPAAPPKPAKRSYDESTAADPSIPTIRVPTPSPPPEPAASKRSRTSVKASKARADDDDDDDATQGYKSSRQVGTTSLPIARVSKIMKADKDLNGSAKDAVFLIAVATEEFIKRLAYEGYQQAKREGRTTVQQKDLATVTKRLEEFNFLSEMIPFPISPTEALKRAQKRKAEESLTGKPTAAPEEGPLAKAFKTSTAAKSTSKKKAPAKEAGASTSTSTSNNTASSSTTPTDGISALSHDVGRAAITDSEMDVS